MAMWRDPDDWDWVDWFAVGIALVIIITLFLKAFGVV